MDKKHEAFLDCRERVQIIRKNDFDVYKKNLVYGFNLVKTSWQYFHIRKMFNNMKISEPDNQGQAMGILYSMIVNHPEAVIEDERVFEVVMDSIRLAKMIPEFNNKPFVRETIKIPGHFKMANKPFLEGSENSCRYFELIAELTGADSPHCLTKTRIKRIGLFSDDFYKKR